MLLQAQLVHAEPGRRVVLVSAHNGTQPLGSALGEAADAEQAEDRALQRLLQRLGAPVRQAPSGSPAAAATAAAKPPEASDPPAAPQNVAAEQLPSPAPTPAPSPPQEPAEPPPLDPDDWSAELAQLELQLQRIGWEREQEGLYLQRAFGHPSRSRITTYADLSAYLRSLEALPPGSDPASAPVPLRRRDLLSQCDELLGQLGWQAARGRSFLEQQFQVSSRSQLSDAQLLAFNMLLEGELIGAPASCHTPGDD